MKTELEKDIEGPSVVYAISRGWVEIKIMSANKNGWPDRFFFRAQGAHTRVVCIEFKKVGKAPTRQQFKRHGELRAQNVEVYWTDSFEEAKQWLY